jgi:predicted RNA-binding Zn-ribbon protein involved in translation (DUF1610 family)
MTDAAAIAPASRAALATFRRRQRVMLLLALVFLVIVLLTSLGLVHGFESLVALLAYPLLVGAALTWFGAMFMTARMYAFVCPRCGKKYFARAKFPWWHNNLSQRCMNCGLALKEADAAAAVVASE